METIAIIIEIFETLGFIVEVIDGVVSIFEDLDGDGEADDPALPYFTFDEDEVTVEPEKTIIIVSPDGTMSIYDENGNLEQEDAETAYTLWLNDNGALTKPFSDYSVTEFLLLVVAAFAACSLIGKLFKRRHYV